MRYDTVVVGAGAIGLAVAYYLADAGHEVAVVERSRVAAGASEKNAGEICPTLMSPLPAPGIVKVGLGNIYRRDSSFYVHPTSAVGSARFLARFARYARRRPFDIGKAHLLRFGGGTHELFHELSSRGTIDRPVKVDYLHVSGQMEVAKGRLHSLRANYDTEVSTLMDGDALRALEPTLGPRVGGGYVVKGEAYLDPAKFCESLARRLVEMGAAIHSPFEVRHFVRKGAGFSLEGPAGTVEGHRVVLAAGVGTRKLARQIAPGPDLPIYPGKGYSFKVVPRAPLKHLLKLEDVHVGVIPNGDGARIAGTMEFDGYNPRLNFGRVNAIVNGAKGFLDVESWDAVDDVWVGSRPMTPDGLPIIGRHPYDENIVIAGGHNMLGIMLAPRTGVAVRELILNGNDAGMAPFRVDRFSSRNRWRG